LARFNISSVVVVVVVIVVVVVVVVVVVEDAGLLGCYAVRSVISVAATECC